jgi:hypothetical protein
MTAVLQSASHILAIASLLAGAMAALVYIPFPRLKIGVAAFLAGLAVFVGAYDAGWRARARVDETAELRRQIDQRDALLARKAQEAEAASAIAEEQRRITEREEEKVAELRQIVEEFRDAEPPKSTIVVRWRTARTLACPGDARLGRDFARSLQRLDRAAARH